MVFWLDTKHHKVEWSSLSGRFCVKHIAHISKKRVKWADLPSLQISQNYASGYVCQDVSRLLLPPDGIPDVLTGALLYFTAGGQLQRHLNLSLESQLLNESASYYNYSLQEVLQSPSDLLGMYLNYSLKEVLQSAGYVLQLLPAGGAAVCWVCTSTTLCRRCCSLLGMYLNYSLQEVLQSPSDLLGMYLNHSLQEVLQSAGYVPQLLPAGGAAVSL